MKSGFRKANTMDSDDHKCCPNCKNYPDCQPLYSIGCVTDYSYWKPNYDHSFSQTEEFAELVSEIEGPKKKE